MGTPEQPAWTGDPALAADRRGLMVLGTPLGHPAYIARRMDDIAAEHGSLLLALRDLPTLQSAWLMRSLCASPRSNYYLRSLPPSASAFFAARHDAAMQAALSSLLDDPRSSEEDMRKARAISQLPFRLGGLGLRSATRMAQAAYWASWADCLPMIRQRHPAIANHLLQALALPAGSEALATCLQEARRAREQLMHEGFGECPTWARVMAGERPDPRIMRPETSDILIEAYRK